MCVRVFPCLSISVSVALVSESEVMSCSEEMSISVYD